MKRLALIMCLLLLAAPALALSVNFEWDYDAIEEAKITGFHAWLTKNPGIYSSAFVGTFANTARTGSLPEPDKYGKWCWVWTAYYDDAGVITESDYSNEVCEVFKPPKPQNLRSTIIAVLTTPAKAVGKLANLFKGKRQLRIIS
jgi:hypothetical protein